MIPSEKVLSFMDDIDRKSEYDKDMDSIRNSVDGKLRCLDRCKQDAKNKCIDYIFSKIYNDATPLPDEYKTAYRDDLTGGFRDFIGSRSDRGMDYYIHEARKRSEYTRRLCEAVDDMIEREYRTKEMNIENIDPDDLVFKSNDDTTRKLDVINRDLSGDNISDMIRDQVKQTALSEIRRAKEEKDNMKRMETDLANDPSITNQQAVENALDLRGVRDNRFYTPSLFEGVLIHKYNKLLKESEEGTYVDTPLYGAMDYFKENGESGGNEDSIMDHAFVEAVKEYTALSMLRALKLESFTYNDIVRIAEDYAYN